MSKEAVGEFLIKLDEDVGVRLELSAALEGNEQQAPAMVEVAARHGLEFTPDEYAEVIASITDLQDGVLRDDELEAVAGGLAGGMANMKGPIPTSLGRHQLQNFNLRGGVLQWK